MAGYPRAELLVSPQWLADHLNNADLKVIDARGAGRYTGGHIPGAANLPVARLDDPTSPIRSALLPAERFGTLLGNAGVSNQDRVVVYDDGPGLMAARLFWAMHYYGHEQLAILDGGLTRWAEEGRPLATDSPSIQPQRYTARAQLDRGATKEEVSQRLGKEGTLLLDVRSLDEYTGAMVQAARGGHIPGARFLEWSTALADGASPALKSAEQLQKLLTAVGATPDKEIVTYCQGGVRAAHTYYVLRLLGYDRVRNYTGSWGDWGNDPALPVEQGEK
ncbi:MAG: sulfurtransferase [Chloroflexi bacterium]|nr:sulfurtransferase [Chloroflexota bacterium]